MPILSPDVIGTWYYLTDGTEYQIVENFTQTKSEELQAKPYVQGDIGTRVMAVGGVFYEYEFSSDALILLGQIGQAKDVIGIIRSAFEFIKKGGVGATYLLENARITVNRNSVNASAKYISDVNNSWTAVYGLNNTDLKDLIARTAQWYDCRVEFETATTLNQTFYQIESANFNISVNIGKRYFINQNQTPNFSIESYTVTGEVTILVKPTDFNNGIFDILRQGTGTQSQLIINGFKNLKFYIGAEEVLVFGANTMISSVKGNIRAGQITTVTLNFTAYSNYTGA